ncbi:MAG: peptide MFS transporter [Alphaproteobacteria bacterium]|nr:peptide MFS transporter [Alphaproteobacteria bacterium]
MAFDIFKKYPQGFSALFFTQACFNFSFYGLKSIFLLYVIAQFDLSEKEAISLFATLMALSYATSLIGGWVADNGLGTKNAIILGGVLQATGISFLMSTSQEFCLIALAFISLGSGFFKPTLSTSVGMLFENPKDSQKDKAYSTFYLAMNLGSFIAPLLCGFISKAYGGYYNSLLLIVVTLSGGVYLFYQRIYFRQRKEEASLANRMFSHPAFIGGFIAILLLFLYFIFKYHSSFNHLMGAVIIGSITYFGRIFYLSNPQEKKDLLSISLYILLFTIFCSLFEQAGSSLMLFFDKAVDRQILGIEFPAAALLSLGPIFVLMFGPLLILFSEKVLEKKRKMDGLIKLGVGFLLTGLSFLVLAVSASGDNDLASPFWIIGAIFLQTIGELWIVPIGFSNISKLSPPRFRSLMMSFWLMAIAYGHYFGGFIAQFSIEDTLPNEPSLTHYQMFFLSLSIVPCFIAAFLFFYHYIKKHLNLKKIGVGI